MRLKILTVINGKFFTWIRKVLQNNLTTTFKQQVQNTQRLNIATLGTGAVGGFFGGLLAEKYAGSDIAKIIFITRAATEKIIRKNGLKLISGNDERIVFPDLATSDPENIGNIDLLICCVKSYDLEESLLPLRRCINKDTVILPLLNGVDARQRILKIFPEIEVWDGCVYIVSRLKEPGIVKESGGGHSFYFGSSSAAASKEKLNEYLRIFKNAGINATLSENIEHTIWEKFLFISSLASLTSYLDKPLGAILEDPEHLEILKGLMQELIEVARAKGIYFPEDVIENRIAKMRTFPYETTSSMHSDFQKGGKTEYRSLTEYVVRTGKELKIKTPLYSMILERLLKKNI
jgi:2-dehydropantoate 2-reductase